MSGIGWTNEIVRTRSHGFVIFRYPLTFATDHVFPCIQGFEYLVGAESAQSIYDFSRVRGDTLRTIITNTDTTGLICAYFSIDSTFGQRRRTWIFTFAPRHIFDASYGEMVADSIGDIDLFQWGEYDFPICGAFIAGKYYGTLADVDNFKVKIPTTFTLFQNYPYPFNPLITITYDLPEQSLVSLRVFDILGQEIATLVDEIQSADKKLINFNPTDLANGVYYYRMLRVATRPNIRRLGQCCS